MKRTIHAVPAIAGFAMASLLALGQSGLFPPGPMSNPFNESGKVAVGERTVSYRIRRLPVSSFPQLPAAVADTLNQRGCLIPQTYEAHQPENAIHASLEGPGSSDWAVLCSVKGTVSLLVFFAGAQAEPVVLVSAPESERLQAYDLTGVLGFNWGIDPASPQRIHEAQAGMERRPARLDHDALADSIVDHRTVYHFYRKGAWEMVDLPN